MEIVVIVTEILELRRIIDEIEGDLGEGDRLAEETAQLIEEARKAAEDERQRRIAEGCPIKCEKMRSFHLKTILHELNVNEHQFKESITGRKGNPDLDICRCEDGRIRLRKVNKCNENPGPNDPDIDTGFSSVPGRN